MLRSDRNLLLNLLSWVRLANEVMRELLISHWMMTELMSLCWCLVTRLDILGLVWPMEMIVHLNLLLL